MRKFIFALAMICGITAQAQINGENDKNCFNHLSVGVGVGTTGIGVEVGTTICPIVTMRAGVDFMPGISYKTSVDFDRPSGWYDIPVALRRQYLPTDDITTDIKGTTNTINGKLLFDIYTGKNCPFHFTVGAYFGSSTFATIKARGETLYGVDNFNKDIDNGVPGIGNEKILLEGYELGIDQGRAKATAKTSAIKPYIGFGIGRTTPRKRVGVKFEMGAMFWGKPTLHDDIRNIDVKKDYPGLSDDFSDGLRIAGNVIAYPQIKLTLFGRIF